MAKKNQEKGANAADVQQENAKVQKLSEVTENSDDKLLTTSTGVKINHTDDSLKAGKRGPTIMEDFHFREKMTHFDHERIPERVVHARGSAAHGFFQVYEPLTGYYTRKRSSMRQKIFGQYPAFVEAILHTSLLKMSKASEAGLIDYIIVKAS